jgi:cold shock CspA family protein
MRRCDGPRHGEVVQRNEGLRIHPARGRRQDVFVHISAVERAGLSSLAEGRSIEFEVVSKAIQQFQEGRHRDRARPFLNRLYCDFFSRPGGSETDSLAIQPRVNREVWNLGHFLDGAGTG